MAKNVKKAPKGNLVPEIDQEPSRVPNQDNCITVESYLAKEYPGLLQENVGAVLMAILREIVKGRNLR